MAGQTRGDVLDVWVLLEGRRSDIVCANTCMGTNGDPTMTEEKHGEVLDVWVQRPAEDPIMTEQTHRDVLAA